MRAAHVLSAAEMEEILASDRTEVLDLVRRVARREVTEWDDGSQLRPASARWVLLRLADPEVLEIIGNQLAEYQYVSPYGTSSDGLFDDVLRAKQPKLLPYFARGVFRNEDAETRDFAWNDFRKMNRSMNSLYWMLRLTYELEVFPAETRAWARVLVEHHSLPENEKRELGRVWWRENEKAILAGNYAAVRPGISPAQGIPSSKQGSLSDPNDAKRVWPPGSQQTQDRPSPKADVSPRPAKAPETPTQTSGNLWLWLAGIATLLAAVALILKRKTNKPH